MPASTTKNFSDVLSKVTRDHPGIHFLTGVRFAWDPKNQSIHYPANASTKQDVWTLLHEIQHALLKHKDFQSDFELLQMEVAAWQAAKTLARRYGVTIDQDYIEDCLDSYRDWLHARATCPTCLERCLQTDTHTYTCHNCHTTWHVTKSRLCRTYRRKKEPR